MNRMLLTAGAVSALLAGPALAAALAVGAAAPDFNLTAYKAGEPFQFNLKNELKKGPVVLYFFPGAYTAGCNIEAQAFAAKMADFRAAGAQVVGVTAGFGTTAKADPSKPYTNLNEAVAEFSKTHCNGEFPVVVADSKLVDAYGVPLTQRPGWSDRSSFVISKDDKVVYSFSNLSPNDHIPNTLKAVQDLKGK